MDDMELMRLYAFLPQTEREALDETIQDQGSNDLASLLKTMDMVRTYFKESIDV